MIAFIGSVFSPYYAWQRRHGPADPLNHCALNVALYTPRKKYWAMTERGAAAVQRETRSFVIGPSCLTWHGDKLVVNINEVTMPRATRLRGTLTLVPTVMPTATWSLTDPGEHRWSPLAPIARVEVDFQAPALKWSGNAYLDHNRGSAPLENAFTAWHWSRASHPGGTVALYDAYLRDGTRRSLALRYTAAGDLEQVEAPATVRLPATKWRIHRETRAEQGTGRVLRTLEDTPFYARSLIGTRLLGTDLLAVHESLSLTRFRSPLVQAMLPFRMPRRSS